MCFIFTISTAYADLSKRVLLIDKATGKVEAERMWSVKNETILNGIKKESQDLIVTMMEKSITDEMYTKWDGAKVVVDTETKTAKEYEASVKLKTSIINQIEAINTAYSSEYVDKDEQVELNKQKAELEAKVTALENK